MDPNHRLLIKRNETTLINLITFDLIHPHLVPLKLFTQDMVNDFLVLNDEERRTALIKDLPTRGPLAFQTFGNILLNTGQHDAAELLGFVRNGTHLPEVPREGPHQNGVRRDSGAGDGLLLTPIIRTVKVHQGPEVYRMESSPRGLCLIINNHDFSKAPGYENRDGTDVDKEMIKAVFNQLDFLMNVHDNLTAEAMKTELKKFSQNKMHEHMDAAVVFLLSHGTKGMVVGVDGVGLSLKKITNMFDSTNSIMLQNKPKLFFVQACRGEAVDYGAPTSLQTDARNDLVPKIPTVSDIVVSFSCNEDYVAYRDRLVGSWYISSLMYAISKYAHEDELLVILRKAETELQKYVGPQGEMTSGQFSCQGLRKLFYFNPGHP